MGSTFTGVVAKLNQTKFYPPLFQAAFGTPDVNAGPNCESDLAIRAFDGFVQLEIR